MKKVIKKIMIIGGILFTFEIIIVFLFCINITGSLPKGIFIRDFSYTLNKDDYVRFKLPVKAIWIKTKTIFKKIAALPGDYVCITKDNYYANNLHYGCKQIYSPYGKLPDHRFDGAVPSGSIYVYGQDNSFDSRYWGPVLITDITKYQPFILF